MKTPALVLLLSLASTAFGSEFAASNNDQYQISYTQSVKDLTANPGDNIFSFRDSHRYSKDPDLKSFDTYEFVGRTGEKAFQVKHVKKFMDVSSKNETLNLYFEAGTDFPLQFHATYSGCGYGETVKLRMLELKGNQLGYKLVYPSCLLKD